MPKQKSKRAQETEGNFETATFTFPCRYCGGETFTIREFGNFGKLTAVCQDCQGTEAVTFLDV